MRKNLNLEFDLRNIFKEEIYDKIKNVLVEIFLNNMKEEREGKLINSHTMKVFVEFMNKIENNQSYENLYSTDLEQSIYTKTEEFYRTIIDSAFQSKDYHNYMRWGIETVINEENHLRNYLPKQTIAQIIALLKNIMFFNIHREIIDKNNSLKYILHTTNISVKLLNLVVIYEF
jgi:hypothetical protein